MGVRGNNGYTPMLPSDQFEGYTAMLPSDQFEGHHDGAPLGPVGGPFYDAFRERQDWALLREQPRRRRNSTRSPNAPVAAALLSRGARPASAGHVHAGHGHRTAGVARRS